MTVSEWFTANKPPTLDVLLKVKRWDGEIVIINLNEWIFDWGLSEKSVKNWEVIEEMNRKPNKGDWKVTDEHITKEEIHGWKEFSGGVIFD